MGDFTYDFLDFPFLMVASDKIDKVFFWNLISGLCRLISELGVDTFFISLMNEFLIDFFIADLLLSFLCWNVDFYVITR
jgi:hypothetical protein